MKQVMFLQIETDLASEKSGKPRIFKFLEFKSDARICIRNPF